MRLISNKIIYDDGRHNAFTSMVKWRDRYWVTFRNGTHHRSHDGRVLIMSSADLEHWSEPTVAIDTPADDRDPKLVVWQDRLFVATNSVTRAFEDETHLDGKIHMTEMHTSMSQTADGVVWETPWVATEPFHFIWWMRAHNFSSFPAMEAGKEGNDGCLYATERKAKQVVEDGVQKNDYYSAFLQSADGRSWQRISMISTERMASEVAFDFLADGRAVGFVRHDLDHYPEIKVAKPPYTVWETVIDFPFKCNGPSLDLVGDTLVISGRAFFEDPATPLLPPDLAPRLRGLLIMTVDLEGRRLIPQLMLPHITGPLAPGSSGADEDARFNAPDISYASAVDLGGGEFAMSYYEGYKGTRSSIRLARLSLAP
jgi:hypothetical protein